MWRLQQAISLLIRSCGRDVCAPDAVAKADKPSHDLDERFFAEPGDPLLLLFLAFSLDQFLFDFVVDFAEWLHNLGFPFFAVEEVVVALGFDDLADLMGLQRESRP